VPEVEEKKYIL